MMLTDRQKQILSAIVNDYIVSAEPVGSRSISKRGDVGVSPATIRNEMSDLEEMGFLEQPHTSAGRIPSHKGYRYFVDHLIQQQDLREEDLQLIKLFFAEKLYEAEETVQQVATILSSLTQYTAIALGPEIFTTTLKHIQLIPLNDESAVTIIVTNTGHVENKMVSIPKDVPMAEIEKFINLLNKKLVGVPLLQVRSKLYNEISNELKRHVSRYQELIIMLENVLQQNKEDRIFVSGTTNILSQPEFKDVEKVRAIFELFDRSESLAQLFTDMPGGIQVRIGAENHLDAIHQCSLITATYSLEGQSLGTIGIIGPTRMEYGKVINLLDYLSKDMAVLFSRWYK